MHALLLIPAYMVTHGYISGVEHQGGRFEKIQI